MNVADGVGLLRSEKFEARERALLESGRESVGDMRDRYQRDGYVVVRSLFDRATVRAMAMVSDALREAPDSVHGAWKYYDDGASRPFAAAHMGGDAPPSSRLRSERIIQRVERFRDSAPVFGRVFDDPALTRIVTALLGDRPVLFKEKLNYKPCGGSALAPHQDMQAGWARYAPRLTSAYIAIDAATRANGCMEVAVGAHQHGLLGAPWEPLSGAALSQLTFQPIELDAGDVAFFDAYTPHRAGANTTPYDRRALLATYNRASDGDHYQQYFADKFAALPPHCAREPGRAYAFHV